MIRKGWKRISGRILIKFSEHFPQITQIFEDSGPEAMREFRCMLYVIRYMLEQEMIRMPTYNI
jgi:hypothetical protein